MIRIDEKLAAKDVTEVELFSFFSGEKYLSKYLNSLARHNIYTVGDIARETEKSFFQSHPTSEENRKKIVENLAKVGVHIT